MKRDARISMKNQLGFAVIVMLIPILLLVNNAMFTSNKTFLQTDKENSNLILGLTNQSSIQIKLKVYVDNTLCINEDLAAGGIHSMSYHNYKLTPGSHVIKVIASDGSSSKKQVIVSKKTKWTTIAYWFNEGSTLITIDLSEEEPGIQ